MGLSKKLSCSCLSPSAQPVLPNPDPSRFKVLREQGFDHRVVVLEVQYPDCTNYEGRKVLVFQASGLAEIMRRNNGKLDPHFSNDPRFLSPVARFTPDAAGWLLALDTAKRLLTMLDATATPSDEAPTP